VWRVDDGGGGDAAGGLAIGEEEGVSGVLGVLAGCAGKYGTVAGGVGIGSTGSADRRVDFFRGVAPSCEDTTARSSSRPDEGEAALLFTSSSPERCAGCDCGGGAGRGARFTAVTGPLVRKHRRGAVLQSWHVLRL